MKTATASDAGLGEKLIMTVLLTVTVGPLVGTIVVFLFIGIVTLADGSPESMIYLIRTAPIMLVILLSYVAGGLQALICGLSFAALGWKYGELPIGVPLLIGPPLALVFTLVPFGLSGGTAGLYGSLGGFSLYVVVHTAATLVTWWLVKAYWQKASS